TKSPLTDGIAFANSGGFWGAEFKKTGHDAIVLEGASAKPVYLLVEDGKVEVLDASGLWGKTTIATTEALKEKHGKNIRVLCIGPAGETLSRISAVMNDEDRAAGRGGVGAVLGSKKVKAIVTLGSGKFEYADPEKARDIAREKTQILKNDPVAGNGLPSYGTAVLVNIINQNGALPTKNYQESYYAAAEDISGETLAEKHLVKKAGCFACPIQCGRVVKSEDGREIGGPEYETIWAYGSDCDVKDLKAINKANELCNEYGLDTISAGTTIACAMELYQRGFIKDEHIKADGISLKWGDSNAIVKWTEKMGKGEGFGKDMAMGSYRLAEKYGAPELSMSVKKMELPAYDPRAIQGQGVSYATCNRGGCHVKGYMISPEILGYPEKLDRTAVEGKAEYAKVFHDLTAAIDALGLCVFTTFGLGVKDYVAMANAVFGEEFFTEASLLEAGERIYNLEKLFNLKAGLTKSHDTLPKRILNEPIPAGPSEGQKSRVQELIPQYYAARGWNAEGIPTEERLAKLGLK
ncbi:MAG: aldehyde ferredoxin oxidoreductase family protein, partial [Treponema sp.]|nr:aldehyde ferredoxin oxidoreductase family protein [Treponema sp.]